MSRDADDARKRGRVPAAESKTPVKPERKGVAHAPSLTVRVETGTTGAGAIAGAVGLRDLLARTPVAGEGEHTLELLLALLREAAEAHASDIHLDPGPRGYDIRFRVDGVLRTIGAVDADRGLHVARALKSQAGMDPGFEMKPQTGRADFAHESRALSVRVATAPGVRGEKMALRLLTEERKRMPLGALGMSGAVQAELLHHISDVRGMILVSGPAGSGKTTTLYALMQELAKDGRSIVTVEDPVEFVLQEVTQIEVNERQGLDFAEGVRSLLRLDPDIIVLGEMRDAASARAALQAADTGHVCLSTLHARDAAGTITALRNFECRDHEIAAAVDLIIAQRLVRLLCAQCRRQEAPTVAEAEFISAVGLELGGKVWHASGCRECGGSGYRGRIGVFETYRLREEDAGVRMTHAEESAIRAHMWGRGSHPLLEEAPRYVAEGLTSLAELRRGLGLGYFGPRAGGRKKRR